jgi:hypothetical protein
MIVHFFFWSAGLLLQRAYLDLFGALLHTLLDRHHELVSSAFPTLCFIRSPSIKDAGPEYDGFKRALASLSPKAHFLNLAFFIDGVDEFEGDQVTWPYCYEV